MSNLNIAVYAEGCMYPDTAIQPINDVVSQLQQSGFTTLITSLFHIGRNYSISPPQIMGDIYFNDKLVISEGSYVGDQSWPSIINSIPGGSITQVCASIGGGGVMDYQTIQKIYEDNGNSFSGTNLERNFEVFRSTFPAISIIDLDNEDNYDKTSLVAFCQMLIGIGFDITFCPYQSWDQQFWDSCLASLNASNPGAVKWWNLQCYDGGNGNDPQDWANNIKRYIPGFDTDGFILAGDWINDSPSGVESLMQSFKNESCVGGGFIWTLDSIIQQYPGDPLSGMKAYVNAISSGLSIS
ncbi:MAG: hypothetical protein ED557_02690 [Balneola sp.]|nr:MAG: hypothetical protein ED557_02690 [Balneola sp.]